MFIPEKMERNENEKNARQTGDVMQVEVKVI